MDFRCFFFVATQPHSHFFSGLHSHVATQLHSYRATQLQNQQRGRPPTASTTGQRSWVAPPPFWISLWPCNYLAMWLPLCSYVAICLYGYVAMCVCGYVAMCLCDSYERCARPAQMMFGTSKVFIKSGFSDLVFIIIFSRNTRKNGNSFETYLFVQIVGELGFSCSQMLPDVIDGARCWQMLPTQMSPDARCQMPDASMLPIPAPMPIPTPTHQRKQISTYSRS